MQKQWIESEGRWKMVGGSVSQIIRPGIYELVVSNTPSGIDIFLEEMTKLNTDKLLAVPGSLSEHIVNLITHFWNTKEIYEKMGLLHKRGVLLEGVPGTGKTATALLVAKKIVEMQGVVIFVAPVQEIAALGSILKGIRETQPQIPIMTIMEDIDKHKRSLETLLSVLDGENQVANIFHLATTNFIEKLDARILNRPSRFDEVIKVTSPKGRARDAYIRTLIPASLAPEEVIQELVTKSQGLMFAHIKELVICTIVYGRSIDDTVKRLTSMAEKNGTGFSGEDKEDEFPKYSFRFTSVPPSLIQYIDDVVAVEAQQS